MPGISNVLSQHPEQASFLWLVRSSAVTVRNDSLTDLAKLDLQVEAHIDGLRVAGEEGWQLARKEMGWKEPGEIFAAAVLAFESGLQARIAEVLNIGAAAPELVRGVVSALGWMEYEQAEPHIRRLCTAKQRSHRRIGIAAAAIHRRDPGQPLRDALSSGDPLLRARAARAAGELGRADLVPVLQPEMKSEDPGCRFWAAWSIALLSGYGSAIEALQAIAAKPGPFRERAHRLALRRLSLLDSIVWNADLGTRSGDLRLSVIGAGILGFPSLIPGLIEQMSVPPLARVAGEAFTTITGIDLAYHDLDCKQPEDFEAGPTEDPDDDNVEMDPDERLPWPNAVLIAEWWGKHQHEFLPHVGHLLGKPVTAEWLEQVLRIGRQRQRAAAALELAIQRPGSKLFEVRAPGFRQQQILNYRASH